MRVGLGLVAGAGCDVEVTVDQLLIQFEFVWELWSAFSQSFINSMGYARFGS